MRARSRSRRTTRSSPTSRAPPARSSSTASSSTRPRSTRCEAAGVKLVVPLVSQGELIGLAQPRARGSPTRSTRPTTASCSTRSPPRPRRRSGSPSSSAAQEAEARSRERLEQELRVATLIQQHFLPQQLPDLPGWQVAAYYRPAREVGGDFYDFIELPDGRIGIVIGDVTDKGVPAALVMAATRSVLRASAQRIVSPGRGARAGQRPACARTCRRRCSSPACTASSSRRPAGSASRTPATTCRTSAPTTGSSSCARPACRSACCPGIDYEETEASLEPGETCCSTATASPRRTTPDGEMFGFPRLRDVRRRAQRPRRGDRPRARPSSTGSPAPAGSRRTTSRSSRSSATGAAQAAAGARRRLDVLDRERAGQRASGDGARRRGRRAARPRAGAARAAQDGRRRGDDERDRARQRVDARSCRSRSPSGGRRRARGPRSPTRAATARSPEAEAPDLEAKLAGEQKPRGWGLFLIQNMVDDVRVASDGSRPHGRARHAAGRRRR